MGIHDQKKAKSKVFVLDPQGTLVSLWHTALSFAVLYNFWVICYRQSFYEIYASTRIIWLPLDFIVDLIYLMDIILCFRTGFLMDGVLQTDGRLIRIYYLNSMEFYIDCFSLIPLDFLYISLGFQSIARVTRLAKIYKFWLFLDRLEGHCPFPNTFRVLKLIHYMFLVIHWNTCFVRIFMALPENCNKFPAERDFHHMIESLEHQSEQFELHEFHGGFDLTESFPTPPDRRNLTQFCDNYLECTYWSTLLIMRIKPSKHMSKCVQEANWFILIYENILGILFSTYVLAQLSHMIFLVADQQHELARVIFDSSYSSFFKHIKPPCQSQEVIGTPHLRQNF